MKTQVSRILLIYSHVNTTGFNIVSTLQSEHSGRVCRVYGRGHKVSLNSV
jgi:hypothetical protein